MRRLGLAIAVAALLMPAASAQAQNITSSCSAFYTLRSSHPECSFRFAGFPIVMDGSYIPLDEADESEVHVEIYYKVAGQIQRPLGAECEKQGTGTLTCHEEWNPGFPTFFAEVPYIERGAELLCSTHSHEDDYIPPFPEPVPYGEISCSSGGEVGPGPGPQPPGEPDSPTDVQSVITSVPINQYAPTTVFVDRSLGLLHLNEDLNQHDIVSEATRPDGSAPWCSSWPSGECPLFWSPLISRGGSTLVTGIEDTEAGEAYPFYCTIHDGQAGVARVVQ